MKRFGLFLCALTLVSLRPILAETREYTLPELLQIVIKSNEQIQIAESKVGQMRLLPWRAAAQITPRLSASGNYIRQSVVSSGVGTVVPNEQRTYVANVKWPIWQFEFLARTAQGYHLIRNAEEEYRGTIQDVTYSAIGAYLEFLKAEQLQKLAVSYVKQAEKHLAIARSRFKVGETRKTALLQAELDLLRAQKRQIEASHGMDLAEAALRAWVPGLPEDFSLQEWTEIPAQPFEGKTLTEILSIAQKNRPDLLALSASAHAMESDESAATMRLFPTLSIDGQYQIIDPASAFSLDRSYRITGTLSVPIFQGGDEYLSRIDYGLQVREARLRLTAQTKQAEIAVRRAYLEWDGSRKSHEAAVKGAEIAKENFTLTEKSFREGLVGSADLADAHTVMMEADYGAITEKYDLALATLGLQKSAGMLKR